MRPRNRRRPAGVIGGRDLDHVTAPNVDPRQRPQQRRRLRRTQATPDRRASAGCEGRIEDINVEGKVNRRVADEPANLGPDIGIRMHSTRVNPRDPIGDFIFNLDSRSDLDATCRVDHPFLQGLKDKGAVIDPRWPRAVSLARIPREVIEEGSGIVRLVARLLHHRLTPDDPTSNAADPLTYPLR